MYGYSIDVLGRSWLVRMRPAKQSSVNRSRTSPGRTRITGSTPPNVHAYCSGFGSNRVTSVVIRPPPVGSMAPSEQLQVLLSLPVGDPVVLPRQLVAAHHRVRLDELLAEELLRQGIVLERRQRLVERSGQL